MQTLIIKDLSVTAELDSKAMAAVRGGYFGGWKLPVSGYEYDYPTNSTTSTSISVSQANNMLQSNATGNGSAIFGGSVLAFNNQQGSNSIG